MAMKEIRKGKALDLPEGKHAHSVLAAKHLLPEVKETRLLPRSKRDLAVA